MLKVTLRAVSRHVQQQEACAWRARDASGCWRTTAAGRKCGIDVTSCPWQLGRGVGQRAGLSQQAADAWRCCSLGRADSEVAAAWVASSVACAVAQTWLLLQFCSVQSSREEGLADVSVGVQGGLRCESVQTPYEMSAALRMFQHDSARTIQEAEHSTHPSASAACASHEAELSVRQAELHDWARLPPRNNPVGGEGCAQLQDNKSPSLREDASVVGSVLDKTWKRRHWVEGFAPLRDQVTKACQSKADIVLDLRHPRI